MRIKEGYVLKKLGTGFVVVTIGEASKNFNGFIRLNSTGAFIWQRIEAGDDTREKLIASMKSYYTDMDEQTAREDLEELLKGVAFALEE